MTRTIAIIGTLDTKADDFAFLKRAIEEQGCDTLVINVGVLAAPGFAPDISAETVALSGGETLEALVKEHDRGRALDVMTRGAAIVARRLYDEGRFDAIISMGGGGGTAVGASAMRSLPIGVPKVMVSTLASGDTAAYVGTSDIVMFPSVVDVAGVNRVSRVVYGNAAAAVCAMAKAVQRVDESARPLLAVTMFGNTTRAVGNAREVLEAAGYEVLVFHATGAGGRTMESLLASGFFVGILDMTTTEWADELCGGVLSAGPDRLDAAGQAGIPQVVVPGCLDMCNFWASETIPAQYKQRLFYHWNPNVTLMRTSVEEMAQLGAIFARKLNAAQGPVVVMIPAGGLSEVDVPGGPFWSPEADRAFIDTLRRDLHPEIPVIVREEEINAPDFSAAAAHALLELLAHKA